MSLQRREVGRRGTGRDWKHEAEVEGVGVVIIVDPANGRLKGAIWRVRWLRKRFRRRGVALVSGFGLPLPLSLDAGARDGSRRRRWRAVGSGSGRSGELWLRRPWTRRLHFAVVPLGHVCRAAAAGAAVDDRVQLDKTSGAKLSGGDDGARGGISGTIASSSATGGGRRCLRG